jgi:hypothetical protein
MSNLRSKPIQGYVTDSAGNIIRNAGIVVYRGTPDGLAAVDSVNSDDEGYFISNPLPNGTYDIFESGIRTSRIIHNPDFNSIPCFKASKDNYYENDISSFSNLVDDGELNNYKYFLQIESEDISIDINGSSFPLYNIDLSALADDDSDAYHMAQFLILREDSRLTTSRFDIEYFQPLTATQASYRRIKWAGVPGIRFKSDSKIVVPLDYFSIVANNPFKISGGFAADKVTVSVVATNSITITGTNDTQEYVDIYNSVGVGDIVKLAKAGGDVWYGVVLSKSSYNIVLERWRSSRFASDSFLVDDDILTIKTYHGIFQGMSSLSSTINSYFTVVENISQQTVETELYNYQERY